MIKLPEITKSPWLYREIDNLPIVIIDDFGELVFLKKEDAVVVSQLPEILEAACRVIDNNCSADPKLVEAIENLKQALLKGGCVDE